MSEFYMLALIQVAQSETEWDKTAKAKCAESIQW